MKNVILLLLILGVSFRSLAQDILLKRTGEELPVKVLEITPETIKYVHFNQSEGPATSISRSEVSAIKFENGQVERFDKHLPVLKATPEKPQRKNSLALNMLPVMFKSFNIFYDHRLNPNVALSFGCGVYIHEEDFFTPRNNQFIFTGAAKFFLGESDFYLSPYLKYRNVTHTAYLYNSPGSYYYSSTMSTEHWNQLGGGATFGMCHIFKSGFLLESFLGLGGYAVSKSDLSSSEPSYFSPAEVDPRLGVALGFAF